MAKKQSNVVHDNDAGEWRILERNAKGDETVKDTIPDVQPMGEVEALQVFQGLVREETNARRAALSMLCHIYLYSQDPAHKLDMKKHVGKGDMKTGNLGAGIKEEYRQAEDVYFKQWADPENPQHKVYKGKLPKLNERSEAIAEEDRHAYFVTRTRKSPSYANAKNVFLNYLAFVGGMPFDVDSNNKLVGILPPEVMRTRVTEAKKNVPGPDNSWSARLQDLIRQLVNPDDPNTPTKVEEAKLPALIQDVKSCLAELERREKLYRASQASGTRVMKGDVIAQGDDAIKKMQESTGRIVHADNPETGAEPEDAGQESGEKVVPQS